MQANLGLEAQPPTPGLQNVILYPYVNPATELIDATNLPKNDVIYDANGNAGERRQDHADQRRRPTARRSGGSPTTAWTRTRSTSTCTTSRCSTGSPGTTSSSRRTPTELGWKDTVRISPLEDTIVALRPIVPELPWEVPERHPDAEPDGCRPGRRKLFNNVDAQGNPTAPITNQLVNFGWEYVWHCHILSHEEMDMMRPQTLALPPVAPSNLTNTLAERRRGQPPGRPDAGTTTPSPRRRSWCSGPPTWAAPGPPSRRSTRRSASPTSTRRGPTPTRRRSTRTPRRATTGCSRRTRSATWPTPRSRRRRRSPSPTPASSARSSPSRPAPGAGGSITPSGAVAVGRGGSQTFTFTPNAGYRIIQVLVNGIPNAAAATAGTLHVHERPGQPDDRRRRSRRAGHHHLERRSRRQHLAERRPDGGDRRHADLHDHAEQRLHASPTLLVDTVNDPAPCSPGRTRSRTCQANHTIDATFRSTAPVTVTAPNGGESFLQGSTTDVTWNVGAAYSAGYFDVWVYSPTTSWYQLNGAPIAAVPGRLSYSMPWTVAQPPASDYRIRVWYRDAGGNGVVMDDSNAVFTISALTLTVTAPNGGESHLLGSATDVTWTLPGAVSTGSFEVWAYSPTTSWYQLNGAPIAAVPGQLSYSMPWAVAQPPASDYRIRVWYRDAGGNGVVMDDSNAVFTISATDPHGHGPERWRESPARQCTDVTWTLPGAVSTGSFEVWAYSPTTSWYQLNGAPIAAVPGQPATACPGRWHSRRPATTRSASGTGDARRQRRRHGRFQRGVHDRYTGRHGHGPERR